MKFAAVFLAFSGAAIGTGAAMEFAYFGPRTPQFIAGVIATPAGASMIVAAAQVWRIGCSAHRLVMSAGISMAAATIAGAALDVMGPPAVLIGIAGSAVALTLGCFKPSRC